MITRIQYTIADGNVWTNESDYDMVASLTRLAEQTEQALRTAYPEADVTVARVNASGAVRVVRAESDYDDGYVSDNEIDTIETIAARVWETGDWYVAL